MGTIIQNGAGNGNTARVDESNRLHTRAVTNSEQDHAAEEGDAYNINSGLISLTSAGESGILYVKNNETRDLHVEDIFVILGPSTGGVVTDTTRIRVYKNPTTGTLISTATAADTNSNRHFSSSNTFASLAYKGAEAETITDGTVHIESLVSPDNRVPFAVSEILANGDSIAISYEPNDSNTAMKVMAALTGHLEDPKQL